MELKSLVLGLVLAVGIFALKSGCGLHYWLSQRKRIGVKIGVLLGFGLLYLALFLGSCHVHQHIDLMRYFDLLQAFFESGMVIHVAVAAGLFVWGIALLKQRPAARKRSLGWLALVVPCPVCAVVIFLVSRFLVSYFPDASRLAVLGAYLVFMAISLLTVGCLTVWSRWADARPESSLGAAMLFIAGYFCLSVLLMPRFGDLSEVYRLAAHSAKQEQVNPLHLTVLLTAVAAPLSAGFWFGRRQIEPVQYHNLLLCNGLEVRSWRSNSRDMRKTANRAVLRI